MVQVLFRVALDLVSALNSWWNSGSSFYLSLNDTIPVAFEHFRTFNVSKVPVLLPLYEVLFADFVVSKDSDICWIFDGRMMDFCWVCKELSSKKCRISAKVSSKKCDYLLQ